MSEVTPKPDLICEAGALAWGMPGVDPAQWIGGLVAWGTPHGAWSVVEGFVAPDRFIHSKGNVYAGHTCPLLPPRPADPAEVLRCLAALPGAVADKVPAGHAVWIPFDFGQMLVLVHKDAEPLAAWYRPDENQSCTADNYAARGRDHAKEGALRVWLAQPATEVA